MKVLGSISDRKGTCKWLNGSQEGKGGILQTGDSALVQFFKKIKKKNFMAAPVAYGWSPTRG